MARFHKPISPATSCIARRQISQNSSSGMPIFSHSAIVSRSAPAAKSFSLYRLRTDFGWTLASFLSG